MVLNVTANKNNAEEQICQIGNFIFDNMMDDVIILEDIYELLYFPTATVF